MQLTAYLHDYKLVKEFGESVDRMYREMEKAGQPDPTYVQNHFILRATLKAKTIIGDNIPHETTLEDIIMEAI